MDAVHEAIEAYNPLRVIAFGSRARGEGRPDSDLDLAIILDELSEQKPRLPKAERWTGLSVDRIVARKEVHQRWAFAINSVHHDIATQGILLYARAGSDLAEPFYSIPSEEEFLSIKDDSIAHLLRLAKSDETALNLVGQPVTVAAFHGQQSLEKLMKAWLTILDAEFPRVQDRQDLRKTLEEQNAHIPMLPVDLKEVNEYAVGWRYNPPSDADELDLGPLREAVRLLRQHIVGLMPRATS